MTYYEAVSDGLSSSTSSRLLLTCENWISLEFKGGSRIVMWYGKGHPYARISTDSDGYPWIPSVIHRYPWITNGYSEVHVYAWLSVTGRVVASFVAQLSLS